MGLFSENKEKRFSRYAEAAREIIAEHDRTYPNQIKNIYENYKIVPDEFDPKIKLKKMKISKRGIIKYRFLGLAMVFLKYTAKKGYGDEFTQLLLGMCRLEEPSTLLEDEKPKILMENKESREIFDEYFAMCVKAIAEANHYELAFLHIDSLGESLGKKFIESKINTNALQISSLSIAEQLISVMKENWR